VLDIKGGHPKLEDLIILYDYHGGDNQKFQLILVDVTEAYSGWCYRSCETPADQQRSVVNQDR
jgi:hypothetical protein